MPSTIPMDRLHVPIDGHSYLVTYNRADTKIVIVFVHGIFGDYQETWKETPVQLMTSQTLSAADWGSFGYGTKYIDFGSPVELVDQFVLWAKTHLARYEQIYLVAHSMGGLLVRNACAKLVSNTDKESHRLFCKIKRCFLIAVPVSGAKAAKLISKVPILKRLNWRIQFLAQQTLSRDSIQHYDATIREAEKLGLSRPRFSLFIGTTDRLVGKIADWAVTKDDEIEGPIPGNHDTVKTDLTLNSTLIKRIVQAVNSDILPDVKTQKKKLDADYPPGGGEAIKAAQATAIQVPIHRTTDVLLLSCSSHKQNEGETYHPKTQGIWTVMRDKEVAMLAIQTRVQIMNLIQRGRIDGTEFKEGNRIARPENQKLILGPDFGGAINQARYLPAYRRYVGRSYQVTQDEWQQFLKRPTDDRPDVMIMSGMYGLFPMDEYIQNYDCHITDRDIESGQIVRDYWGTVMTRSLISHLV